MTKTKISIPTLVQAYDYHQDREYYKHYSGLIFGYDKLVRTDRLEDYLLLTINMGKMPDKILFNGKEVKLVEI